jgi:hypothetical protein
VIQRVAYLLGFVILQKSKGQYQRWVKTSNKSVSKFPGLVKTPIFAINKSMDRMNCNVMDVEEN